MKTKRKVKGSLNSKNPNPYELAYKELWDRLPAWKRAAVLEDIDRGYDSGVTEEFVANVSRRAEELYMAVDKS